MKLIEADGKRLLRDAGIAIPRTVGVDEVQAFPVFVKAQILQGHRGQRGLVRKCENAEMLQRAVTELTAQLRDIPNAGLICEEEVVHETEWFVSIDIDRLAGKSRVSFSPNGGMDVERAEHRVIAAEEDIASIDIPSGVRDVLRLLYHAFPSSDALRLEINPLACRADGSCVALDAKVELDDAAAFRHPEWATYTVLSEQPRERSPRELAYAELLTQAGHRGTLGRYVELDGDIAMILSGGGASLVAMDALKRAGGTPANYVEMSGNPDPEQVFRAASIVLSKPGIRAVWIAGSFANFTDIQVTVNAVLRAITEIGLRVPVGIRRDGPHADDAQTDAIRWASDQGIPLRFDRAEVDLDTSARAIVEASRL
jgi:succinyl-CoA synthetase beta subunit